MNSLGASKGKRFTIFLISPRMTYWHHGTQEHLSHLMGKKRVSTPVVLPILARLTPDHYDIYIVDEDTERTPRGIKPDIVAMTSLITTIDRAFEISAAYHQQGALTVVGGAYASVCPDHVAQHVDVVFAGEAEESWPRFLKDFEAGNVQRIYRPLGESEFKTSPYPRWDLVDTGRLVSANVQTSRGCPFNCEFCLVGEIFGQRMRFRDLDDIVEEIRTSPLKTLFFTDDNLTINKQRAKDLMNALKPLEASWVCQCSLEVAEEDELLQDMAEAGCIQLLIGFESVVQDSLAETRKGHYDVDHFARSVQKIHDKGIHVMASFAIGFDHDQPDIFDRIFEFVQDNNIIFPMFSVLTAAPGTDLYARMLAEGRIEPDLDRRWYNGVFPSMHYYHLSMRDMLDGYFDLLERVFDWEAISERVLRLYSSGAFARSTSQQVPFIDKARTFLVLLRRFAFSRNKTKRNLFRKLFELESKQKLVAMDKIVVFLLTMEGYHEYLNHMRPLLDDVRRQVAEFDKGPWKDVKTARRGRTHG